MELNTTLRPDRQMQHVTSLSFYYLDLGAAPCCVLVKYIDLVPRIVRPDHQMHHASLAHFAISLPLFSKCCNIRIHDVFWSQHLGCLGETMSRIRNNEVYATLPVQFDSQSVHNSVSLSRMATPRR